MSVEEIVDRLLSMLRFLVERICTVSSVPEDTIELVSIARMCGVIDEELHESLINLYTLYRYQRYVDLSIASRILERINRSLDIAMGRVRV